MGLLKVLYVEDGGGVEGFADEDRKNETCGKLGKNNGCLRHRKSRVHPLIRR